MSRSAPLSAWSCCAGVAICVFTHFRLAERPQTGGVSMWGTVLVLAFMAALDPGRLGIAILLTSRPRPMLNLLAFWIGGMATGIAGALGALILLRDFMLKATKIVSSMAASSTAGDIKIAAGVLALLIAASIAVGF